MLHDDGEDAGDISLGRVVLTEWIGTVGFVGMGR